MSHNLDNDGTTQYKHELLEFFRILCAYDIRTPALTTRSAIELLLRSDVPQETKAQVLRIGRYSINGLLNVLHQILVLTSLEQNSATVSREFVQYDPTPDLRTNVINLRDTIEHFNSLSPSSNARDESYAPRQYHASIHIDDDLPPIYTIPRHYVNCISFMSSFVLTDPSLRTIAFRASATSTRVTTALTWTSDEYEVRFKNDYNSFATSTTGLRYLDRSLSLYLSWRLSHLIQGAFSFQYEAEEDYALVLELPRAAA
jgi:hypothetical protein